MPISDVIYIGYDAMCVLGYAGVLLPAEQWPHCNSTSRYISANVSAVIFVTPPSYLSVYTILQSICIYCGIHIIFVDLYSRW